MIRKIIFDNDDTLRKVSKEVVNFDSHLAELLDDMRETMYKADGAGLSAVQVSVLKRVFVIDAGGGYKEFVNPVILKTAGKNKIKREGCLSVPGRYGIVDRPEHVWAKYQDRNGNWHETELSGFEAKAFCHEFDHLNGILYTDIAKKIYSEDK